MLNLYNRRTEEQKWRGNLPEACCSLNLIKKARVIVTFSRALCRLSSAASTLDKVKLFTSQKIIQEMIQAPSLSILERKVAIHPFGIWGLAYNSNNNNDFGTENFLSVNE